MPSAQNTREGEDFLAAHPEVSEIDLLIADGNGLLRGKRIQREALIKTCRDGLCLAGSIFSSDITGNTVEETGLGVDEGDADRLCWPVPGSLHLVPWEPHRAQMLLTMHELDGRAFFADPRQVLASVLARFDELELTPVVAVELEFYLIDAERRPDGGPQPPVSAVSGRRVAQTQVYSIADLDDQAGLLKAITDACGAQQIPAFTAVAEYAPGQYEVNLSHQPDAVAACDDAILLKRLVKALARQHGQGATFMAKPYARTSGSGMHIHVSLLDRDGRNIFAAGQDSDLESAVGGLLQTLPESMALLAPNANSYRRFQPESYVPLAASWGHNNRTVALRIPAGPEEARRIEHRVAGADANPYLVVAALLAGIHHGISTGAEAGDPVTGNADDQLEPDLPLDWMSALEALDNGEVMHEYLGRDFCNVYLETRTFELREFHKVVSALEYEWYLDAF